MFHNNWIVSAEAKEYRLKELGLFYSPHVTIRMKRSIISLTNPSVSKPRSKKSNPF